ncbi:PqqD family protein [Roseovarius sp. B08]|uniref:PqqD family protein n=1 Tax=Roseovarius sp. B08 TaxID=3449223 RepID=UPI003EDBC734
MPDWEIAASGDTDTPATVLRRDEGGTFQFQSWWSDRPLTKLGPAGVTCGAVADILQGYLDSRPGIFGFHCGAVQVNGHLVAFTGPYRAGKTTLVARLGTEPDCALFCDDILPVDENGVATALGVQPRLRLPLPEGLSGAFENHVAANLTVSDERYGFLKLPHQASLGARAPLAAMIVLCRQDGRRARFHELSTADAAGFLIRQNIADPGDAGSHYDRVAAMAENLVCLTLVYSDLEDAVSLIRETFEAAGIPRLKAPLAPALPLSDPDADAPPADLSLRVVRASDVVTRQIGEDMFLWQMADRNFFRLNAVGGAIWTLLEQDQTGTCIVRALHDAFPTTPVEMIGRDVAMLLGQMKQRGLVTMEPGPLPNPT